MIGIGLLASLFIFFEASLLSLKACVERGACKHDAQGKQTELSEGGHLEENCLKPPHCMHRPPVFICICCTFSRYYRESTQGSPVTSALESSPSSTSSSNLPHPQPLHHQLFFPLLDLSIQTYCNSCNLKELPSCPHSSVPLYNNKA